VIPVSPNLLYAYLMTVAMGLHGLQIERRAAEIRRNLQQLNGSFAEFLCAGDTLGSHPRNAYAKYDAAGSASTASASSSHSSSKPPASTTPHHSSGRRIPGKVCRAHYPSGENYCFFA
jgi:RmuC family